MFIFISNKEVDAYVVITFFLPVRAPGATIDGVNAVVIIEGGAIKTKVSNHQSPGFNPWRSRLITVSNFSQISVCAVRFDICVHVCAEFNSAQSRKPKE